MQNPYFSGTSFVPLDFFNGAAMAQAECTGRVRHYQKRLKGKPMAQGGKHPLRH
jgi:hypothetical protein